MALNKYIKRTINETSINRVCMLKPMQAEHQTIKLNAGKNTVGRSKETGIRDTRCSKSQLELNVDLEHNLIRLKVLGLNPSSVNGLMIMQNTESELLHGDVIEIIYGRHPFEVVFKPPPQTLETSDELRQIGVEKNDQEPAVAMWESIEDGKVLVYNSPGLRASEKVASYDLDGTIIKTKSGNVFPKNIDDWELNYFEVPGKLKMLNESGYKICIFTNQAGIARGKVNIDEFKKKLLSIIKKLGVPIQAFIAIANGYYRKPLPGMWEHLREQGNNQVALQLEKCFYVGDAAGRPEIGTGATKRRKDHSFADRFFAANIGVNFFTPEEHFLGKKTEPWTRPEFEPSTVHDKVSLLEPPDAKIPSDKCELVIMVGMPGSGKSHFVRENLASLGYTITSADTLGSTKACLTACERALRAGESCVIDNTNVDMQSRKKFVELATRLNVPCRCFVMKVTLPQSKHNIAFRELTDDSHSRINDMVFNMMKKKYKTPVLDEGFQQIVNVNLKPQFVNAHEERLYKLYLVEK